MPETAEKHVIVLPDDDMRVIQLHRKLVEYRLRDPYSHPEKRALTDWRVVCKERALEKLLEEGRLDTHTLCLELKEKFPDAFEAVGFNQAMGVINDYVTTGGKNVTNGTGLPDA